MASHHSDHIIGWERWVFPLIILAVSIAVTFIGFPTTPRQLAFDEVEFTRLALSLKGEPYTAYSPLATGHSTLYFYIILASIELFGLNNAALRLPAAIFGVITPVVFYFILKRVSFIRTYKVEKVATTPFLVAFLFATTRWYFNFSRFAFEATLLMFLELVSLYCMFHYRDSKKWWMPGIAGVFSGLAFNSYTPGRVFFLIPLVFLVIIHWSHILKRQWKQVGFAVVTFLVPVIVLMLPLQVYFMQHQDIRIQQQFFLANSDLSIPDRAIGFAHNVSSNVLMLFTKGDVNARHNYPFKPALNPLMGLLFIIGLILAGVKHRHGISLLFLIYGGIAIGPTLVTYPWENPNMLRTVHALPAIMYFIAIAIHDIGRYVYARYRGQARMGIVVVACACIIGSVIYDIRTYVVFQVQEFNASSGIVGDIYENLRVEMGLPKLD